MKLFLAFLIGAAVAIGLFFLTADMSTVPKGDSVVWKVEVPGNMLLALSTGHGVQTGTDVVVPSMRYVNFTVAWGIPKDLKQPVFRN